MKQTKLALFILTALTLQSVYSAEPTSFSFEESITSLDFKIYLKQHYEENLNYYLTYPNKVATVIITGENSIRVQTAESSDFPFNDALFWWGYDERRRSETGYFTHPGSKEHMFSISCPFDKSLYEN